MERFGMKGGRGETAGRGGGSNKEPALPQEVSFPTKRAFLFLRQNILRLSSMAHGTSECISQYGLRTHTNNARLSLVARAQGKVGGVRRERGTVVLLY